MALRSSMYGDQ